MGLKDAWKALFNQNIVLQNKEGPVIAYSNVGTQTQPKESYNDLAREGYQENAIVYRCVNEIANGAASVKFGLFRGDQPIEEHPLLDLLMRPNPMNSQSEFFQEVYSYLLLAGNSYILKTGAENREPSELYTLRPDRIKIVPSKREIPLSFEYVVNGQTTASYAVDQSTGFSDVKQIMLFNPLNDYYGLSPLKAASVDIDQHNLSNKHNVMLLMNGARPSGAVVYRPKDESGANTMLTDTQREQLRGDLLHRFEGSANAGRTMILEGDFDYKEMGMSPKDMDFTAMKNFAARDIALCFGVPSQLVGIPDANTYSNMQEARLALYEETIIPMLRHIESDLNEWLVPSFGEDLTLKYLVDDIPAITERRRMIYDNVITAVDKGIITRNEARGRLGLKPIDGGDEVYIPANLFPLGSESKPTQSTDNVNKLANEAYGIKLETYPDGEGVDPKLPDAYQLAQSTYKCINCAYATYDYEEEEIEMENGTKNHKDLYCTRWEAIVRPDYWCVAWKQMAEGESYRYSDAKAIEDTKPTEAMASNAKRALEWRKEFNRGGTRVGVARANQLVNRINLSESVILRMFSFFSRHEVDKQAEGFNSGEKGFPSGGRIAWDLWGGDAGFSWSRRKRNQIMKDREKNVPISLQTKRSEAKREEGISRDKPTSQKLRKAN